MNDEIGNTEIIALLEIASGKTAIVPSDINIPRLISLSFRHKIVYQLLVFAQANRYLFNDEQMLKIESRSRKTAMRSLTQLHELKKIATVFNEKGIGYICIKGPQLSRMLYGREALKESVDLDIMITNINDLLAVHDLLRQFGYTRSNLNEYPGPFRRKLFLTGKREVHYFNPENRCAIDLHIRPGANTYLSENRFRHFLAGLVTYDLEGTAIPVMQDESYLVYLCYHGALHQFARLAWLIDIRAFLHLKQLVLDFDKAIAIAKKSGIEHCIILACALIREYFGEDFITGKLPEPGDRINRLVRICKSMTEREASYGMSLKGRAGKVIYVMMLMKGFAAKADWIYGIFMRQLIKIPLLRRNKLIPGQS
jgi:hypothetical protein